MSGPASLSGVLPDGDANGLAAIAGEMITHPKQVRVVIALVDCAKITMRVDEESRTATVRLRVIEPMIEASDVDTARRLLREAMRVRCGTVSLPAELDQPELPLDAGDADDPDDTGEQ